jgi:uncharacterized protein YjbJ (UPF0337 family)
VPDSALFLLASDRCLTNPFLTFFSTLSLIGQQFIQAPPMIGTFNQHENRSFLYGTDPFKETAMWNKDEVRGKGKQITGAIKDKVGELTNNPRLEAEGESERLEGNIQQKVGKGRRKVSKVIARAGKMLTGKG